MVSKNIQDFLFLPIGSVVSLKNDKKRLMIYGYWQTDSVDKCTYDYVGCFYPEGAVNLDEKILFDHVDIDKVFFLGIQDQAAKLFMEHFQDEVKRRVLDKN